VNWVKISHKSLHGAHTGENLSEALVNVLECVMILVRSGLDDLLLIRQGSGCRWEELGRGNRKWKTGAGVFKVF